jgi:V8-like Glu-specific endopeptidase
VWNRVPIRASILLAASLLLASLFPGLASQAATNRTSAAPLLRPISRYLDPDVRAIKDFWTRERMRAAEPLELTIGASEVAGLGPRGAGDADEPVTIPGSAPLSERTGGQRLRLTTATSAEEGATSSTVPPGEPIPYTAGMISDTEVFPNITHGKLFFQDPGVASYVCSGTVVGSATLDVVWTAGHCVASGEGSGFYTNFLFVPGYNDGAAPGGEWVGEYAVTSSQWRYNRDFRHDVAALTMAPNGSDQEIQEVVGARGIAFNEDPNQTYRSIGHPEAPPFDGRHMFFCDSDLGYHDTIHMPSPAPMAIGCDMTGGSSGGGWIVEDEVTGEGIVQSVNSYGYEADGNEYEETMFGPQLGNVAAAVHEAAGGEAAPDTTAPRLTNVTDGPDPFTPLRSTKRKTTIKFTLDEKADVTLTIKSRSGTLVAKLPTTRLQPNRYSVIWNGRNFRTGKVVRAGTYTYKIKAKDLADNPVTKSGKTTVKR